MRIAIWSGGECRDVPPAVAARYRMLGLIHRMHHRTTEDELVWPDGTHVYWMNDLDVAARRELEQYPLHKLVLNEPL